MSAEPKYTGESYRLGELKPIKDPRELREVTVRDYKRNYQRLGVDVEGRLLERLAVSDLELVDMHRKGLDASPNYARPKPVKREAAKKAIEANPLDGLKLKTITDKKRRQNWLNMPGDQIDEKWTFMMGRLKRIADGASQSSNMLASMSTTECPDLALRIRRVMADYMLRHRQSKHNPFTTATGSVLNDRDAFRKFRRMLEDICDASAGRLGPWWVPK